MTEIGKIPGPVIRKSVLLCALAYVTAGSAALGVGYSLGGRHTLVVAAICDMAATTVVFFFSVFLNNSSVYDPYWSVAPIPIAVFFAFRTSPAGPSRVRLFVVCLLVCVWGIRLTHNWLRGWGGLAHEDWRYVSIRKRSGRLYWPVSFLAIHLVPTAVVFLGCFSLYVSLSKGESGFRALDAAATVVVSAAIWFEARADRELRRFKFIKKGASGVLSTGLWEFTRHPNYFGEVLFWWGLFLFSMSASPEDWWAAAGPVSVTLLFVFISIPMMERHMEAGRPGYEGYRERTSVFIPLPRRFANRKK